MKMFNFGIKSEMCKWSYFSLPTTDYLPLSLVDNYRCKPNEWACTKTGTCISVLQVCNQEKQCIFGEDEEKTCSKCINTHLEGRVNRFNPTTFLCLSHARTWISNVTWHSLFVFSEFSQDVRWLFVLLILVKLISDHHCMFSWPL